MADLKKEYVDIRGIQHKVEHLMVSPEDKNDREQIVQELFLVLAKADRAKADRAKADRAKADRRMPT